jgi:hypothetical protein
MHCCRAVSVLALNSTASEAASTASESPRKGLGKAEELQTNHGGKKTFFLLQPGPHRLMPTMPIANNA